MIERVFLPDYQPSLAEFRNHLRLTTEDLDAVLEPSLLASIEAAEHHIGKIIAQSSIVCRFPFASILELKGPAIEIEEVRVDDKTLTTSEFKLGFNALEINKGIEGSVVTVRYKAGMVNVPHDIKAAILLYATRLFNNPADSVESMPSASKNLLAPHRSWGK